MALTVPRRSTFDLAHFSGADPRRLEGDFPFEQLQNPALHLGDDGGVLGGHVVVFVGVGEDVEQARRACAQRAVVCRARLELGVARQRGSPRRGSGGFHPAVPISYPPRVPREDLPLPLDQHPSFQLRGTGSAVACARARVCVCVCVFEK